MYNRRYIKGFLIIKICNKPLSCGRHTCLLPCHAGACPSCSLTVTITCDCGYTSMEVPCKEFRRSLYPPCQQLCQKPSHCHHSKIQDHYCHSGNCPECILTCNALLPCGHTCQAICHENHPCPPCHTRIEKECEGKHCMISILCCDKNTPVFCTQKCNRLLSCGKHVCIGIP